MKTKIKTLGVALVLSAVVLGVNASELRSSMALTKVAESNLEVESWMLKTEYFETKKSDSESSTVVEIAVSNPDFSILVEAVAKAGLVEALSADGPFTVFAPTNAAFNNLFSQLGVSGIEDLTAEQLTPILTYHVVSGKVMSTDLTNTSVGTLNDGKTIKIDISDGVKINDSNVVAADISGKNGVIHVIDKVLIPN
jgi:transforming growth factor-beta-induced protein